MDLRQILRDALDAALAEATDDERMQTRRQRSVAAAVNVGRPHSTIHVVARDGDVETSSDPEAESTSKES